MGRRTCHGVDISNSGRERIEDNTSLSIDERGERASRKGAWRVNEACDVVPITEGEINSDFSMKGGRMKN